MASFYEDYLNNKKTFTTNVRTGNTATWASNQKKAVVQNTVDAINRSQSQAVYYLNNGAGDEDEPYSRANTEIGNIKKYLNTLTGLKSWMDEDTLPTATYEKLIEQVTSNYNKLTSAYEQLRLSVGGRFYNKRNSGYDGSVSSEEYTKLIQEAEDQLSWYKKNNETVLLNSEAVLSGADPFEVYGGRYDSEISDTKKKLEDLKSANYAAANVEKYSNLYLNDDYKELSAIAGITTGDTTYKYINNLDGQRDKWVYDKNIVNRYDKYDYMTDSEIQDYNYIYNTQGETAANDYLAYLSYTLNERRAQNVGEKAAAITEEHPLLATGARAWNSLMSGKGLVNVAGQKIANTVREATGGEYRPVDYNRGAMDNAIVTNAITDTTSEALNKKSGTIQLDPVEHPFLARNLNGKGLGDLYHLGMSMYDSAVVMGLSLIPGVGTVGAALLGGASGTQGMIDALERGASDSQALSMGILNGAAEMVFEKVSIDNLLKGNAKNLVLSVLQQSAVEGSEELFTTIANTFSDILVMGDKSEFKTKIAYYMSLGMTEKEAEKQALMDVAFQLGYDFLGGAISGGVFGASGYGGRKLADTVQQNAWYENVYGGAEADLVAESLDIDPENAFALKMQNRLDEGKSLRGGQLKKLVQQNEAGMVAQDMADIQGAATTRLAELGETGDVHAIGAALAKQAAGESLTKAEKQVIAGSKYGKRVANELNAENIRSGEYASEWAQNIGTSRINAEEYNAILDTAGVTEASGEAMTFTAAENAAENTARKVSAAAENGYTSSGDGKTLLKRDGSEVEIEKVENLSGGVMTLRLTNGNTVNANDVEFATEGEALVYDAVASLDVSPAVANSLIDAWKDDTAGVAARDYALGVVDSFRYGSNNMPKSQLENSQFASKLTALQRNNAYVLGQHFSGKQVATAEAIARRGRIANKFKTASSVASYGGGKVVLEGVDESTFTERQKASVSALETVADALGVSFHLFESDVDASGKRVGANGWYVPGKGELHIDVKAGSQGQDTILFTASHELTHFIKDWSPAKFKKLSNFLMQEYGESDVTVEELVQRQIEKAKRNGRDIDFDTAFEEVVADSMETMLADGNVVEKLAKLKTEDRSLWEKIRDFIRDLAEKIKKVYAGLTPDSAEGRYVAEMKDKLEEFQNLFTEGLAAAGENFQAAADMGIAIDTETESVAPIPMMSERTWENLDSEYLDAVKIGDMKTAQRLVDEAAEMAMPDSKIRDKNGKLLPVYHGTKDMFYVFDTSVKGGVNGTAEGFGIYTSDNTAVTQAYGERQIKMYANITKPASSEKKTITAKKLTDLIKDTCIKQARKMVADDEYGTVKDALMDTWISNYVYTYDIGIERAYRDTANEILRMNSSDMEIVQEVMNGLSIRTYGEAFAFYRESLTPVTGIDGFATKWHNRDTGGESGIYLAFGSSQLKSADPVTYDDNGDVIPLSERFNREREDIRYSERDYFANDIEQWNKNGKPENETFILGSTGDVLQGLGAIESDIYMLGDKIKTITEEHPEITLEEIKKIPQILENPVLILESRNASNRRTNTRMVMFGSVKAQNGLPMTVILDLRPVENNLVISDMQKVTSAYAKDNNPVRFVENSNVLYADKKRTTSLLRTIGFQMPIELNESGYVGSISYVGQKVKMQGVSFAELTSTPQNGEKYSERDTESLSNRSLLANAFEGLAQNDVEKAKMAEYKENIAAINEQERILHETNAEIRELSFGTGTRDQARLRALRDEAAKAANRIDTYDRKLLRLEASKPLQNVLERAKTKAYKKAKDEGKKALEAYREKAEARQQEISERYRESKKRTAEQRKENEAIRKYRERIKKDVDELTEWILRPNNKTVTKHVPEILKTTVTEFIETIDFSSKRSLRGGAATKADQQFIKRMQAVRDAIKNSAQGEDLYSGYLDLPEGFTDTLQEFIDTAQNIVNTGEDEYVINQMTSGQLQELSKILRSLKTFIKQMNVFHANAMYQHVYEAADETIDSLGRMQDAGKNANAASNYLLWKNIRPAYAFERFGKGGEAIYDGLRRGQAQLAFNSREIIDFAGATYTAKEVKNWEEKTIEISLGSGESIRMPVANIMSLYKLKDRPQALRHILGEGVRVATYKDGKEVVRDAGHKLTEGDVDRMVAALTPRQKQVADKLQQFMARRGGEWGNHVSVARFGEKLFGEKDYFPIHSDGRHLQADAGDAMEAASLYRLLNMSFTKEVNEKANNRLVLYSIFDVFANHMSSMAQYNAMALPVLDALKWFNYRQKDPVTGEKLNSVRDEMNRVYGAPVEDTVGRGKQGYAEHFVANVLKAFNGTEAQGSANDSVGLKLLSGYNKAAVAANLRVVIQQPTAIIRAGLLVDMKNIVKGLGHTAVAVRKNIEEMQKYSGIAAWKDLGFYDVNISRGVTDMIKHKTKASDWITEKGLWLAEKADKVTWAAIWNACKIEVRQKQGIRLSDPGFYEATAKLFEDVVYKTQVVDSVLTKSEYMRDRGFWARMTSSFMSEPVTTASMVFNAYDKYSADIQRGNSRQEAWKKNGKLIARTAYVYALGGVINATAQAVADAFRDDDDYEKWLEKFMAAFRENLVGEMNLLDNIPVVADAWESLVYGVSYAVNKAFGTDIYANVPQLPLAQMGEQLYKATEIFTDKISGKDTNYTVYGGVYKMLQFLSGLTGLPAASLTREVITIWNNTVGALTPGKKVKTYELEPKAEIKYAFQDGFLTEDEATAELLAKDLADDANEAYFIIREWEAGDGYSRYGRIYDAVRNDGDFEAAMEELTSHGYAEKDVISQVKSEIGKWYKEGTVTKDEASRMLLAYTDMDGEDIDDTVAEWTCVVETGIAYSDMKEAFLNGEITKQEAISYRTKYGGYSTGEATQDVSEWAFEKDYGFAYSERIDQFKAGNLSASELLKVTQSISGKDEEEAKTSLSGYIRDGYEEGAFSRSEAYTMLTNNAGLTADNAELKLTYIDVKKQYPDVELNESWVSAYYAEIESSGIDLGVYLNYRTQVKDITGTGKKARRMAVIDSLPISSSQKTALYYSEGWAASRLYEAPWA